ncbi:tRNA (uracil(54)-C(5))-methyltransferase [Chionoecetes opilio]|uniref:tRNA (uracil(54)-C(5))-methyltransferase n=1 Tax=Chionoecetes opilio TaxID=41210 RepID=A0A8J5D4D8_CHIOP|nr:tRNA (uracil(54)-C(5))-methyltransferase [Chionoecetes opilio]
MGVMSARRLAAHVWARHLRTQAVCAVKCGGGVSGFFPVNTGVRQGCVLAPSLFNACMDWVLGKVVDQSDCGASVGNTKITDLVFADDAVIFAESLEVLVMALEALHEEAKPLGLKVSWLKTKVQVFGDLLDEAVQSVHACGEDIEILESFTYLGSAVHNDGGSHQEVLRRIGIAHGVMDSLSGSIWRCRYLCRRTKIRIFKSLVIPVLLYGCETWTLNSDLKRQIDAFAACPGEAAPSPRRRPCPGLPFALVEQQLLRMARENLKKSELEENSQDSHWRKKQLGSRLLKEKPKDTPPPPPSPVTADDQFLRVAEAVTPLCDVPYFRQLKMKDQKCHKVLRELGKRLQPFDLPRERHATKLPCILEPTRPSVSVPPDPRLGAPRPSPELIAYRNKDEFGVHFGVDGNPKTVGFFVGRPQEKDMVCVPPTYLVNMREAHKDVARSFQTFIRQSPHAACHRFDTGGTWRNLVVRSSVTGQRMACVVLHPQQLGEEGVQGIMEDLRQYFFEGEGAECALDSLYLQACPHTRCTREQAPYRLVAGSEYITEQCLDLAFQISPDSFFQINTKGAEVLYNTIREVAEVSSSTTLLDICCGTGTVSLALAPHVRGTIGLDVTTAAVEDARHNATHNNILNTTFVAGKAEKVLPRLTAELSHCSEVVAVVNPARAGLHPDVIRTIRQCEAIQKLIYVSCKPEGFAMENFVKLGSTRLKSPKARHTVPFMPKYAVPVDLFPHTHHVELGAVERVRLEVQGGGDTMEDFSKLKARKRSLR